MAGIGSLYLVGIQRAFDRYVLSHKDHTLIMRLYENPFTFNEAHANMAAVDAANTLVHGGNYEDAEDSFGSNYVGTFELTHPPLSYVDCPLYWKFPKLVADDPVVAAVLFTEWTDDNPTTYYEPIIAFEDFTEFPADGTRDLRFMMRPHGLIISGGEL